MASIGSIDGYFLLWFFNVFSSIRYMDEILNLAVVWINFLFHLFEKTQQAKSDLKKCIFLMPNIPEQNIQWKYCEKA